MAQRKSGKLWIAIFVLAVLAAGGYTWFRGGGPRRAKQADPTLIRDRVWVDSRPEKNTEHVNGFIALSYVPVGFFASASAYELRLERFDHDGRGEGALRMSFPQTARVSDVKYTVSACNELPPFDLCLDLAENPWGGPKRYYSLRSPDDEARHLGPLRRRILAHLPE